MSLRARELEISRKSYYIFLGQKIILTFSENPQRNAEDLIFGLGDIQLDFKIVRLSEKNV